MLRADELVLQPVGFGLCLIGHELQARRHRRLRATVRRRELRQQFVRPAADCGRIQVQFAQQAGYDPFALIDQRHEQMLRFDLRVVAALCELDRRADRVARFFRVLVDVHDVVPLSSAASASK